LAREQTEHEKADRLAREHAERDKKAAEEAEKLKMAALPPPKEPAPAAAQPSTALSGAALITEIKKELKRVGCYSGPIDDQWSNAQTAASIKKYVRLAHASAAPDEPNMDFLTALHGKSERVCPLECGKRETESDGNCVAKTCAGGYALDEDGDCVRQKARKRTATRETEPAAGEERSREPAAGGGRCGARSCSAAFSGCQRHCAENGGRRCDRCSAEYARCMQTGTFIGRRCQLSGLGRN
jgi:hypothetical protein